VRENAQHVDDSEGDSLEAIIMSTAWDLADPLFYTYLDIDQQRAMDLDNDKTVRQKQNAV
jgi:hypothetical protein